MKIRNRKTLTVLLHLLCWATFLFLPYVFFLPPSQVDPDILPEFEENPKLYAVLRDMVANFLLIGYFYANLYIFIPKFYFKRKYFIFFLVAILSYGAIKISPFYTPPYDANGYWYAFKEPFDLISDWNHHIFRFTFVFLISIVLSIHDRWRQTIQEKLNTEMLYLKSQINPHFLFNTLNTIYSLAVNKSDRTADAIVKLSGMMRYISADIQTNKVRLEKEINYIQSFVDLQRLRWGNTVKIIFEASGNYNGKEIEPLILMPFIENAFKYGVNAEVIDAYVEIIISMQDAMLQMRVTNLKVSTIRLDQESSGIGIENTRQRLKLLYPAKHNLIIKDDERIFSVNLSIDFS